MKLNKLNITDHYGRTNYQGERLGNIPPDFGWLVTSSTWGWSARALPLAYIEGERQSLIEFSKQAFDSAIPIEFFLNGQVVSFLPSPPSGYDWAFGCQSGCGQTSAFLLPVQQKLDKICCLKCHFDYEEKYALPFLPIDLQGRIKAQHKQLARMGYPDKEIAIHSKEEVGYYQKYCPPQVVNQIKFDHQVLGHE